MALFDSQSAAAKELQRQIGVAVGNIAFPGGLGGEATNALITTAILQNVDAKVFDKHNQQSKIVEVHALFTATRSDGTPAFRLEIIWDADNPPVGSTQTAHYGWEISLNGNLVGTRGHVFFKKGINLPYYRLPNGTRAEDTSLKLQKSGRMGTGKFESVSHYYFQR